MDDIKNYFAVVIIFFMFLKFKWRNGFCFSLGKINSLIIFQQIILLVQTINHIINLRKCIQGLSKKCFQRRFRVYETKKTLKQQRKTNLLFVVY